jgi:cysteine-rich repeat protein
MSLDKFLIFFLLIGCSTTNLPNPPELASSVPIGQAFSAVDGTAKEAFDLICLENRCSEITDGTGIVKVDEVLEENGEVNLKFSLTTDALYETAYIFSTTGSLYPLEFEEISKAHPDSDLVNGPIYYTNDGAVLMKEFKVNEKELFEGQNIILSFYCKEVSGTYECNEGKWVANSFNVLVGEPDLELNVHNQPSESYLIGETVGANWKVRNVGKVVSNGYHWQAFFNDKVVLEGDGLGLNPGAESNYQLREDGSDVGEYIFKIKIDTNDDVIESNEENNLYEKSFSVKECNSGETRCYLENDGKVLEMIQRCKDGLWDNNKLRADPCGPTQTCSEGECIEKVVCGNGKVEDGEACDDGNTLSGDACSVDCKEKFQCSDSDGGKNYDVKGTVRSLSSAGQQFGTSDHCKDANSLVEYYCAADNLKAAFEIKSCDCQDGVCVQGCDRAKFDNAPCSNDGEFVCCGNDLNFKCISGLYRLWRTCSGSCTDGQDLC